jgi:glycerophosphoryl diester phosphodiesterase
MNKKPAIIAHRGSSFACHENTMAAFERAVADGADGIELDLRLTADRQWVVHHNAAIPVGREPLRIADLSADDIAKLQVGPERTSVPTLAALFKWAKESKITLTLDIKDKGGIAELANVIEEANLPEAPCCSSFHRSVVSAIRHERPEWEVAWIVGNPRWRITRRLLTAWIRRWAVSNRMSSLNLHERWITPSLVHDIKTSGLSLAVWTVDDPMRMAMLAMLGVDAIITNRPEVGREVIDGQDDI